MVVYSTIPRQDLSLRLLLVTVSYPVAVEGESFQIGIRTGGPLSYIHHGRCAAVSLDEASRFSLEAFENAWNVRNCGANRRNEDLFNYGQA